MPSQKKDIDKKEKAKSTVKKNDKSAKADKQTPVKKDPKFLTSQVEDRIKALAKNHAMVDEKNNEDKKELHITHEEETKKVTKDTASIVTDSQEIDTAESSQQENKEHAEAHVQSKDEKSVEEVKSNEQDERDNKEPLKANETENTTVEDSPSEKSEDDNSDIAVVQSESLFARSIAPVVIGIIVGVLTAGSIILFYNAQSGNSTSNVTPTPTVSESPTNTPAPTSIVDDLSLYDITVLNGSGTSGQAALVEGLLEDEGFSVLEIGNAANSNFTTTIIQAKEDVPSGFVGKLQEFLSETYAVSINSVPLAESAESDVVVTIGSLQASQSSASATPTP